MLDAPCPSPPASYSPLPLRYLRWLLFKTYLHSTRSVSRLAPGVSGPLSVVRCTKRADDALLGCQPPPRAPDRAFATDNFVPAGAGCQWSVVSGPLYEATDDALWLPTPPPPLRAIARHFATDDFVPEAGAGCQWSVVSGPLHEATDDALWLPTTAARSETFCNGQLCPGWRRVSVVRCQWSVARSHGRRPLATNHRRAIGGILQRTTDN